MIKLILTGALGTDCEVQEVGTKKAITFKVSVHLGVRDKDGNKVERTELIKAVLWKNEGQSTSISDFLKKGQQVYIEGFPASEVYMVKEGVYKSEIVLDVKEIELFRAKLKD